MTRAARVHARRATVVALLALAASGTTACGTAAARSRAIHALGLVTVDGGRSYRTPGGCRVESVSAGRARVAVLRADDARHLFVNRTATVAVKAVGLGRVCRGELVRRLRALP